MEAAPSLTARLCAAARAAHLEMDGAPKILADPLAGPLSDLGDAGPDTPGYDQLATYRAAGPRVNMVLRARYVEDAVAERAAEGPLQYVMVGAGLDTFAHRRPPALAQVALFEIDHPSTQAWKRARLREIGVEEAGALAYVPVDLELNGFTAPLAMAGLDPRTPTVFSLLGVSQYISTSALADAVAEMAKVVTARCEVVMNFIPHPDTLPAENAKGLKAIARKAAAHGEPFVSYYDIAGISGLFAEAGFALSEHLTPALAQVRYFDGRTDGLKAGKVLNMIRMVRH